MTSAALHDCPNRKPLSIWNENGNDNAKQRLRA